MDEHRRTKWGHLRQASLICIPLLPAILACLGTAWIPQGRAISGSKVLPPLAFRQYAVNLHEVAPTARLTAPFAFWNRSQKNIEITKLEPSCGCLAPRLLGDRKQYGPGTQGLFEVQVETARETPGPHTYSIRVHYKVDEQVHQELVTFRCEIPERNVTVTPPELYFYQLSGQPIHDQIRVEDHRGKNLTVVEAISRSPHVKLSVGEKETLAEGRSITPVQITVDANLPPGSHHNFIVLKTDDPDFPVIRVPVFLQGKPTPSVQLTNGIREERPATVQKPAIQGAAQ
ncbi:DUF1573 domain-containing protein [Planctomicrobium sp. SH661]|uniref:COG1470 family protein n=1 Tax=Planctomicrobium sp. SH661 TaxID=3448124 RepID=UPI003F5B173E